MRIYYRSNTIHLRHLSYFDSNVDVKLQGLKNVFLKEDRNRFIDSKKRAQ